MVLSPAKINLYLHVCGKRADGYHLLESLMVPLAFGDRLFFEADNELSLKVIGGGLESEPIEKNLVMKAACALQAVLQTSQGAQIVLHKQIPHAAGLGGGSSNAAITITSLLKLWNKILPQDQLLKIAESLGADVPFFLAPRAQYIEGIGEVLTPVKLPKLHVLLVKPKTPVPTVAVFKKGFSDYSTPTQKPASFTDAKKLVSYLKAQRNDLTENAASMAPEIAKIISQLEKTTGCLLARMSGSGATCFGIFENAEFASEAAKQFPEYWTQVTHTL